jgi:hypothetical protein
MKRQIIKSQQSTRFRRWTRTKFAILASLQMMVTIGVLANSISNKSFYKNANLLKYNVDLEEFSVDNDDETDKKTETIAAIFELAIQSTDSTVAAVQLYYKKLLT